MLNIGWSEMAIVAVIALFVIGPKDLPKVLRTIGRYAGKVKAMAREFQDTIDEAVREAELDEVKKEIEKVGRLDVKKSIEKAVDPEGELGKALDIKGFPVTSKSGRAEAEGGGGADKPAAPAGAAEGGEPQKEASAAAAGVAAPERESSAGA